MAQLDGKIAWVTGAGSGIGQATARALAGAGATLVLSGRREAALAETASGMAGPEPLLAPLDITDIEAVRAAGDRIAERFGRLDIQVNNAGMNVAKRRWDAFEAEDWDRVVRTNINGLYYCVSAALPAMRAQGGGLIVNIASWAGRYDTNVAGVAYSASKHAVLSLNASLNIQEFQNGIRATAICPAEVSTPIMDRRPTPVPAEVRARMLQPEDLAQTILFVATMPPRACLNEILISPVDNSLYKGLP